MADKISKIKVNNTTHEIEVPATNVIGIDTYELITPEDIDIICSATIQNASEVTF